MVIGSGVAISSTAFASPSAMASTTRMPILNGVTNTDSSDGGDVYESVIAAAVVADAGAGAVTLDARPIVRAATNASTALPRGRITRTDESCRKNRATHSGKRRMLPGWHCRHHGSVRPATQRADVRL